MLPIPPPWSLSHKYPGALWTIWQRSECDSRPQRKGAISFKPLLFPELCLLPPTQPSSLPCRSLGSKALIAQNFSRCQLPCLSQTNLLNPKSSFMESSLFFCHKRVLGPQSKKFLLTDGYTSTTPGHSFHTAPQIQFPPNPTFFPDTGFTSHSTLALIPGLQLPVPSTSFPNRTPSPSHRCSVHPCFLTPATSSSVPTSIHLLPVLSSRATATLLPPHPDLDLDLDHTHCARWPG